MGPTLCLIAYFAIAAVVGIWAALKCFQHEYPANKRIDKGQK